MIKLPSVIICIEKYKEAVYDRLPPYTFTFNYSGNRSAFHVC